MIDVPPSPLDDALLSEIRSRFHHTARCPITGRPRVFLENGGGSLKLKDALARSAEVAALPDQEGRDNDASRHLSAVIAAGRADLRLFFGCGDSGQVVSGETGTALLYAFVRTACLGLPPGPVLSCNLEHPASFDAAKQWAANTGRDWREVTFDARSGTVTADDYARALSPDTRLATVIHTSQLTGYQLDLPAIARAIRAVAPECVIVVDGIQNAPHGAIDVAGYGVDAYVFSPYKAFSRLAVGFAWVSERLSALPHDRMLSKDPRYWELGSRDPGIYAAHSAVVDYLAWLGAHFTEENDRAARLRAARDAMHAHERHLLGLLLAGDGAAPGLLAMPDVQVIGRPGLDGRQGIVSFSLRGTPSPELVRRLAEQGIRVHARIDDGYSGHILAVLDLKDCLRVSVCHYTAPGEIRALLRALAEISR